MDSGNVMTGIEISRVSKAWAHSFARKFFAARHIVDELAQEAAIGILIALRKYDAAKAPTGDLRAYAQAGAWMRMKRHMNKCAGTVAPRLDLDPRIPKSVGLTKPDGSSRDARSFDPEYDNAIEFKKAVSRQESRVQVMIKEKLKGRTNEQIAIELGMSRECVRQKVTRFFATVDL